MLPIEQPMESRMLATESRHTIKSDDEARAAGFTRLVYAKSKMHEGVYLIKPDADLARHFRAWDTDELRFVRLNGWLWSFEDAEG